MGCVEIVAFMKGIQIAVQNSCWEDNTKINLEQLGWKVWTGFILFTTGFGSQLLW